MTEQLQDKMLDAIENLISEIFSFQSKVQDGEKIPAIVAEDILNQIKEMADKIDEFTLEFEG